MSPQNTQNSFGAPNSLRNRSGVPRESRHSKVFLIRAVVDVSHLKEA